MKWWKCLKSEAKGRSFRLAFYPRNWRCADQNLPMVMSAIGRERAFEGIRNGRLLYFAYQPVEFLEL